MKSVLLALMLSLSLISTTIAQKKESMEQKGNRKLVAYFSATGTTKAVAQRLANLSGADLYEIQPQVSYTDADLNWRDKKSRSTIEMNDVNARPATKGCVAELANYDTIYIGFPIWWYVAPRIINTFIEDHNLEGKTLYLFATSGGSSIDNCLKELKKSYPSLNWNSDARLLNHPTDDDLREWVK